MNSRMVPNEGVESYYSRVTDILCKWANNQVLCILINGFHLYDLKMIAIVKESQ